MATPYPFFAAINSNIYREGLNSAAVHKVVKSHPLCALHPGAVEPGFLVIFARKRSVDVDIRAISCRKLIFFVFIFSDGTNRLSHRAFSRTWPAATTKENVLITSTGLD